MQKDTFVMSSVESSQISEVGHNYGTAAPQLLVVFKNGRKYVYQNVPVDLFTEMLAAESVGKFFVAEIKKKPELFPFEELGVSL